jgi:hypothetical protein
MIFEGLMAVKVSKAVFWVLKPCSFVGDYRLFGIAYLVLYKRPISPYSLTSTPEDEGNMFL